MLFTGFGGGGDVNRTNRLLGKVNQQHYLGYQTKGDVISNNLVLAFASFYRFCGIATSSFYPVYGIATSGLLVILTLSCPSESCSVLKISMRVVIHINYSNKSHMHLRW